jgi:hypothetical protein
MGREIIRPGGSFELHYSHLRRAVRILPQVDAYRLLQDAVVTALQSFELKFWEEFFQEEGEANCIYWARLVGIYDSVHENIIRALGRRRDGDDSLWLALVGVAPSPPRFPTSLDFTSDDMTGFIMYFDDVSP